MSSAVTKLQAFCAYVDMGDQRSIKGLFTLLKEQGYAIGRSTLIRWKDEGEWDKRVPEVMAGRELEAEAAKIAVAARQVLEEAGVASQPATDVLADDDDDEADFIPFSTQEKMESTLEALAAMTSAMAVTVTRHISKVADASRVQLDLAELLSISKATGEIAKATADVHKALNPVVATIKGGQSRTEDGQIVPHAPAERGPVDFDELRKGFANPPRLQK